MEGICDGHTCAKKQVGKTRQEAAEDAYVPSSMLTFGHKFLPSPTMPAWARARLALMSIGICCECGFAICASMSGPDARPQIVDGSTM